MNDKPIITPTEKLAKWKGIKYISFYTSPSAFSEKEKLPPPEAKFSEKSLEAEFSEKELNVFAKRYEEGNDVFDERYGLWLQKYHPEDDVVYKSLFEEEHDSLAECSVKVSGREKPKTLDD